MTDTTTTTTFTAEDVLEAIYEAKGVDEYDHLGWTDWDRYVPDAPGPKFQPIKLELDGELYGVVVKEETGGEGEGSRASVVLQIGSQFFRKEGYYASHYGYDWDGTFEEVAPKEVVKIEYVRV